MSNNISAGVIFLENNHVLLGHSTGNKHWDIPKGLVDADEKPIEAAIRETKEETNFDVKSYDLEDLGEFQYRRDKSLHLFLCREHNISLEDFVCSSFFLNSKNKETPEIDGIGWFDIDEAIQNRLAKNMKKVFKTIFYDT